MLTGDSVGRRNTGHLLEERNNRDIWTVDNSVAVDGGYCNQAQDMG